MTLVNSEDIEHELLERLGMAPYVPALKHARIYGGVQAHSMMWQAIFRHMLVERRRMCQKAEADFFEIQKKAERLVSKLKIEDAPFLEWLMILIATRKMLIPDPVLHKEAKGMIESWQSQTRALTSS